MSSASLAAARPTLREIRRAQSRIGGRVIETPVLRWESPEKDLLLGEETEVWVKMEVFQHGGSFKPRGALMVMLELEDDELARGVTAVSAGNHAIAVAYAARSLETTAKVVMPRTANPFRVARCRDLGAEVVLVDNVSLAFEEAERIQEEEGRYFVHPFEGPQTMLGTATVGLEYCTQVPDLEAVIIPVGGGGLAGGMSMAIHLMNPACLVYGVEPYGADVMYRSLKSGKPESIPSIDTIADSLGAPFALPYSFALCKAFLEEVVRVQDDELRAAMRLMFTEMKIAAEPACAASLAALLGPLKEQLRGRRVGLIACGSNIDPDTFFSLIRPQG
jgi:threonine dehydratase